jgi:hypothetical protein
MQSIELVRSKRRHLIGMEVPRGGSSCASCRFLVDRFYCSLAMWVDAPKRIGGGGGDPRLPLPANRWCCDGYEVRGSQRNPLFGELSPGETFGILATGTILLIGLTYLAVKSISSSTPALPVASAPQQ